MLHMKFFIKCQRHMPFSLFWIVCACWRLDVLSSTNLSTNIPYMRRSARHQAGLRGQNSEYYFMLFLTLRDCRFMPFLILSGQLCPPGIEGTLFALFMSINNFGSTVGSFVGAGLASILNISSGSFDNLLLGIAIQLFCTFIPIMLLFLIPKEATGIAS